MEQIVQYNRPGGYTINDAIRAGRTLRGYVNRGRELYNMIPASSTLRPSYLRGNRKTTRPRGVTLTRTRPRKVTKKYTKRDVLARVGDPLNAKAPVQTTSILANTTPDTGRPYNPMSIMDTTLYGFEITKINKISSTFDISTRLTNSLVYKRFKYNFVLRGTTPRTCLLNYAVIQAKTKTATIETTAGNNADKIPNFETSLIRAHTSLDDADLVKATPPLLRMYGDISTDEYNVLLHKRVTVGGLNDPAYQNGGVIFKNVSGTLNINRKLTYGATGTCETPLYMVYWVSYLHDHDNAVKAGIADIQWNNYAEWTQGLV